MTQPPLEEVLALAAKGGYELTTTVRGGESKYFVSSQQDKVAGFIFYNLTDVVVFLEAGIKRQQFLPVVTKKTSPVMAREVD